jgi:hypothetical protein
VAQSTLGGWGVPTAVITVVTAMIAALSPHLEEGQRRVAHWGYFLKWWKEGRSHCCQPHAMGKPSAEVLRILKHLPGTQRQS